MNAQTKTELTAVSEQPATEAGALALITLSPEKFTAEVYQPFKDQLAAAIDSVRAIDYDIATTAGMATAIKCRATFRDLRIAADKERKARKEPITKIGKLLESGYALVEERAAPLEDLFDADIKAEETRKAEAKAAKEKAEQERVDAIYVLIDAIRYEPGLALGMSVEALKAVIERVSAIEITTEEFSTLAPQAQVALDKSVEELKGMLVGAEVAEQIKREAEAARIAEAERLAAERAENARVKAENDRVAAAQSAEAQRLADIAKAQQEAAAAAQREADAKAQAERDEQQRIAAEQKAAFDKQVAEIAEASRKLAEQQAAHDARLAAELAKQKAAEAAAAQQLADEQQRETDHGPALMMNAEFDVARDAAAEAERVRLQGLADLAKADDKAPAASIEVLMDQFDDVPPVRLADAEIIDMVAAAFDLTRAEAIDRLQAIDFDAARGVEA